MIIQKLHRGLVLIFQTPIYLYRFLFSPWVGSQCRFYPTCSSYALQAFEKHGVLGGVFLTVRRVLMCNPWFGKHGHDPVPEGSIWRFLLKSDKRSDSSDSSKEKCHEHENIQEQR